MLIRKRRGWEIPEREVTPESVWMNRRELLRSMGFGATGLGTLLAGRAVAATGAMGAVAAGQRVRGVDAAVKFPDWPAADRYPADASSIFTEANAGRSITPPNVALAYNNFYEFRTPKDGVWELVDRFETRPWEVEVTGLVDNPQTFDVDDLIRSMPIEERVYRFRCVEAWSSTMPWTGFPFRHLIEKVQPQSRARYISMQTALKPEQMVGVGEQPWYPWPYHEGLTIEEAMNDLCLLGTGVYGKPMPKQNGAPIRLIVPWKFGFKNIKSIVRIEFTEEQPETLWSTVTPNEYGFWANINPAVPHPRWSQATERVIPGIDRVATRIFNGYGEWVAEMYEGLESEYGEWLYR